MNAVYSTKKLVDQLKSGIQIPKLQRTYVWTEQQWRTLWTDVKQCYVKKMNADNEPDGKACDQNPQHFMGAITVCQDPDAGVMLLDGQQRLTTVLILVDCLQGLLKLAPEYRLSNPLNSPWVKWGDKDEDAKKNYERIYNYFIKCVIDDGGLLNQGNAADYYTALLEIILDRFFWVIINTEDNPNKVFEGINASGKNIEYADFVFNFILELHEKDSSEDKATKQEMKDKWNKIVSLIYAGQAIPDDQEEITLEERENKPLKFKKFMNALHSLTLVKPESVDENMEAFAEAFVRLHNSNEKGDEWEISDLTAKYVLDTIVEWGNLYNFAVNPVLFDEKEIKELFGDQVDVGAFEQEHYLLSVMASSRLVPMMMRSFYQLKKGLFSGETIKNLFGAVNRILLYPEIYSTRDDSREHSAYQKLLYADYIVSSIPNKQPSMHSLMYLLCGKTLYDEIKNERDDRKVRNYKYHSRFSKVLLVIDHDRMDSTASVLNLEREVREKHPVRYQFEVEHIVAQNIEGSGGFGAYGYTTQTVDTLYNMVLLEGYLNSKAGNRCPKEKEKAWGGSKLKDYYDLNQATACYAKQSKKVERIIEKFNSYMSLPYHNDKNATADEVKAYYNSNADKKTRAFPFLFTKEKCGKVLWIKRMISNNPENPDFSYEYVLDEDQQLVWLPERESNTTENPVTGCITNVGVSCKSVDLKAESSILEAVIRYFLDCWKEEKGISEIMDFLKRNENENGDFKDVKAYDARIIHTVAFRKKNEKKAQETKVTKWVKLDGHRKSTKQYEDIIEYNYAYVTKDVINHLKKIHKAAKLEFGFVCETTLAQNSFALADNKGTLIVPYENIGDDRFYRKYVNTKYNADCVFTAACAPGGKDCQSYFSVQMKTLSDIVQARFLIPEYQREYVWDEKNWDALYRVMESYCKEGKTLNLGMIIVNKQNEGALYLVDGQQRLTTLGMFMKCFTNETMSVTRKPEVDQRIYTSFKKWIDGKMGVRSDWMLKYISFSELVINDAPSLYQYEVFTAVNGKGKKLTLEEKVKNHIYSCFNQGEATEACDDKIQRMSETLGFIKAFVEMQNKTEISSNDQYDAIKKWIGSFLEKSVATELVEQLYKYHEAYLIISDMPLYGSNDRFKDPKWFWLHLYKLLGNVHTADALLLDIIYKVLYENLCEEEAICRTKTVSLFYFLLYVMDRSGNDKKSINAKLPRMVGYYANQMKIRKEGSEIPSKVLTDSERGILFGSSNIPETIWTDYVLTTDLYDISKESSRFILYLIEYWLGMDIGTLDGMVLLDISGKAIPEVEHIYPVSRDKNQGGAGLNLNWLENVCLLEKEINISVGNKGLLDGKVGKLAYQDQKGNMQYHWVSGQRQHTYLESRFLMPRMFYESSGGNATQVRYCEEQKKTKNVNWIYTKTCAEARLKDIRKMIDEQHRYVSDIMSLFDSTGNQSATGEQQ